MMSLCLILFLALRAQVGVVVGDPVGALGDEDVQCFTVFIRDGLMRDIRLDGERFAGADDQPLPFHVEAQRPGEDVGDLGVDVMVFRDDSAFPQMEAGDRNTGLVDALDRKSTRLNSSHIQKSRMPSSA